MIGIVPDSACPSCGARGGHEDPDLDYPNRPKVYDEQGEWWKCYNPDCGVGYYNPDTRMAEMETGGMRSYEDLQFL